ncbi:MAG: aldo/keto reductase [Spirochaetaceae bacterium]|jgi:predicted aldo/keto reductase-like oxidoreductase|nr:aldo/keto reductase [Spirochaetaceae bacterium]
MNTKMIYRPIGKTGLKAGVIGLGCEHLDGQPFETVDLVVNGALDRGVNMLDIFMPGDDIRTKIGRALGNRRPDVLIQGMIGSTDLNQQYDQSRDDATIRKYFEALLRDLNTDYIDFGMIFYMDTEQDFKAAFGDNLDAPSIRYARELKKAGKIRHIGASSHNPKIARKVVETGEVELLMFSINAAFDMAPAVPLTEFWDSENEIAYEKKLDPERVELYKTCERMGVGISVMKTYAAGKLLDARFSPFDRAMTPAQCIEYALSRPAVASVLLGCSNLAELDAAMSYFDASEAEKDYTPVIEQYKGSFQGSCVYCNHCLPCPSQINIAQVNRLLDIAKLDEKAIPQTLKDQYLALPKKGSDCIACGSCEKKCPFGVQVTQRMQEAGRVFGG